MRRLSMDAGIALGALRPEDLIQTPSSQVQVLDEELANANAVGDVIASDVYNPVSLLFHTLRSNADGLTGAAPSLVIILGSKLLVDWAIKKGVDPHLAHCAMCMTMTEMCAALLSYESPGYIRKRLLVGEHLTSRTPDPPPLIRPNTTHRRSLPNRIRATVRMACV
jgi:hypothetical protein